MELKIVDFFMSLSNPILDVLFTFTNFLGEEGFFFFAFIVIYWMSSKERAFRFGSIYLVSVGVNTGLKHIFARPRPHNLQGHGYSFPSGHSQGYSVNATQIYLECKRNNFPKSKKWRVEILMELIITGILVGIGRMYFGRHFLSDVIAGLTFGIIVALLMEIIYNFVSLKWKINATKLIFSILPITIVAYFCITFTGLISSRSIYMLYSVTGFVFGVTLGYFADKFLFQTKIEGNFLNRLKKVLLGTMMMGFLYFLIKSEITNIYWVPFAYMIWGLFGVGIMPFVLNKTFVVKGEV